MLAEAKGLRVSDTPGTITPKAHRAEEPLTHPSQGPWSPGIPGGPSYQWQNGGQDRKWPYQCQERLLWPPLEPPQQLICAPLGTHPIFPSWMPPLQVPTHYPLGWQLR
jgi:hypothetical protein